MATMLVLPASAAVKVTDDVGKNFNIHQCAQACYFFGSQCDGNPVCHWSSRQLNWSHPVDDYPPEVMNVPVMGDYTQPNIELLLTKKA